MIKIFLQFDISCSSKLKKYLGHVLLHYDTHTDGTDHLEYISRCDDARLSVTKHESFSKWISHLIFIIKENYWPCSTHWGKNQLFIQKLPWIWCLKIMNMNYVKNEISEMWILWKMTFQKYEFCEKWDYESVNFVKNEIIKMWKLRF